MLEKPDVFTSKRLVGIIFLGLLLILSSCQVDFMKKDTILPNINLGRSINNPILWASNTKYKTGDYVEYRESVFRVIQGHTSLSNWTPPLVPALFELVKPSDPLYILWQDGVTYARGEHIIQNESAYEVLQDHKAQSNWQPAAVPALYKPIPLTSVNSGAGPTNYSFPYGNYNTNLDVNLNEVKKFYAQWKEKYIRYTYSMTWRAPVDGPGWWVVKQNNAYLMYNPIITYEDSPSRFIGLESQESDENNNIAVTTSESHGYAMLIAAYMNDKKLFDQLANFYSNFKSTITFEDGPLEGTHSTELMSWQVWSKGHIYDPAEDNKTIRRIHFNPNGPDGLYPYYVKEDGKDSASDGDFDIAYAYLLANKQWGDSSYFVQANKIIDDILKWDIYKKGAIDGMGHIKLGNKTQDLDPSKEGTYEFNMGLVTRPSDFLLDHVKAFIAVTSGSKKVAWQNVYTTTEKIILDSLTTNIDAQTGEPTGLLPDFMIHDGEKYITVPSMVLESDSDSNFYYNAPRSLWRIGVEAAVNPSSNVKNFIDAFSSWAADSQGGNMTSDSDHLQVNLSMNGEGGDGYSETFSIASAMVALSLSNERTTAETAYNDIINKHIGGYDHWLASSEYDTIDNSVFNQESGLWEIDKQFVNDQTGAYFGDTIKMLSLITVANGWWNPTY